MMSIVDSYGIIIKYNLQKNKYEKINLYSNIYLD